MKKTLLLKVSFLCLFLGTISAKEPVNGSVIVESNQFFLIPGFGYPNRISPNGRYVAGTKEDLTGYLWDIEGEEVTNLSKNSLETEALDVNSDGIVCGIFRDPDFAINENGGIAPVRLAGVYHDGTWTNLGLGTLNLDDLVLSDEGSSANAISSDGKTVGGCLGTMMKVVPCTWTKNDDGTWTYNEYSYPSDDPQAQGGKILTLSGDGKIAAGWVVTEFGGPRLPVLWKSPTDYTVISTTYSSMGINNISDNGKYASFTIDKQTAIYYVEEDRYEIIPGHEGAYLVEVTAISDDGLVIGYSHFGNNILGDWRYGFVYSKEMGFVDFTNFIHVFAPNLQSDIDFRKKYYTVPMDISADGRCITGWRDRKSVV